MSSQITSNDDIDSSKDRKAKEQTPQKGPQQIKAKFEHLLLVEPKKVQKGKNSDFETVLTLGNESIENSLQKKQEQREQKNLKAFSREFHLKSQKPVKIQDGKQSSGIESQSRMLDAIISATIQNQNDLRTESRLQKQQTGWEKETIARNNPVITINNLNLLTTTQVVDDQHSSKISSHHIMSFNQNKQTLHNNETHQSKESDLEEMPTFRVEQRPQDTSERVRELEQSFSQIKTQIREQIQQKSPVKQLLQDGQPYFQATEDYSQDTTNTAFKPSSTIYQTKDIPSHNQLQAPITRLNQSLAPTNLSLLLSIRPSRSLHFQQQNPIKIQNFKEMDIKLNSMLGVQNAGSVFNLVNLRHAAGAKGVKAKLEPFETEMQTPMERREQWRVGLKETVMEKGARKNRMTSTIGSPNKKHGLRNQSHENQDLQITEQIEQKPQTQVKSRRVTMRADMKQRMKSKAPADLTTRDYSFPDGQDRKESIPLSLSRQMGLLSEKPDTAQTRGMSSKDSDFIGTLADDKNNEISNVGSKSHNTQERAPSTAHVPSMINPNAVNAFATTGFKNLDARREIKHDSEFQPKIKTGEFTCTSESQQPGLMTMRNQQRFSMRFTGDVTSQGTQELENVSRQSDKALKMVTTKNLRADFTMATTGKTPLSLMSSALQSGELDKVPTKFKNLQRVSRNLQSIQVSAHKPLHQSTSYKCPYAISNKASYQIDFISSFFWDDSKFKSNEPNLNQEQTERFYKLQALRQLNKAGPNSSLLHRDFIKQSKSSTLRPHPGGLPMLGQVNGSHFSYQSIKKREDRMLFPLKEIEQNQHIKRARQNQVMHLLHLAELKIKNYGLLRDLRTKFTPDELDDLQMIERSTRTRQELPSALQTTQNGEDEDVQGDHYSFDQDGMNNDNRHDNSYADVFAIHARNHLPDHMLSQVKTLRMDSGNVRNSSSFKEEALRLALGDINKSDQNQIFGSASVIHSSEKQELRAADYQSDLRLNEGQARMDINLRTNATEQSGSKTVHQSKATRRSNEIQIVAVKPMNKDIEEINGDRIVEDSGDYSGEVRTPEARHDSNYSKMRTDLDREDKGEYFQEGNQQQQSQSPTKQPAALNQTKTMQSDNNSILEPWLSINEPKLHLIESNKEIEKIKRIDQRQQAETQKLLSNSKQNSQKPAQVSRVQNIKSRLITRLFHDTSQSAQQADHYIDFLIPVKLSQLAVPSETQLKSLKALIQDLKQPPERNRACQIDVCTPEQLALIQENKAIGFENLNLVLRNIVKILDKMFPSRAYLPGRMDVPVRAEWKAKVTKMLRKQNPKPLQNINTLNSTIRGLSIPDQHKSSLLKRQSPTQNPISLKIRNLQTQAESMVRNRTNKSPSASISFSQRISHLNQKQPFILDALFHLNNQSPRGSPSSNLGKQSSLTINTNREVIISKECRNKSPVVPDTVELNKTPTEEMSMYNLVFQKKKSSIGSRLQSVKPELVEQNSNYQSLVTEVPVSKNPVQQVCKLKLFSPDIKNKQINRQTSIRHRLGINQEISKHSSPSRKPQIPKNLSTQFSNKKTGDYGAWNSSNKDLDGIVSLKEMDSGHCLMQIRTRNYPSTRFVSLQQSQGSSPTVQKADAKIDEESKEFELANRQETFPIEYETGGIEEMELTSNVNGLLEEPQSKPERRKSMIVVEKQQKNLVRGALMILTSPDVCMQETIKIEDEIHQNTLPIGYDYSPRYNINQDLMHLNPNNDQDLVVLHLNQPELVTFQSEHSLIIPPLLHKNEQDYQLKNEQTPETFQRIKDNFTGHSSLDPSQSGGVSKFNNNQICLEICQPDLTNVRKSKSKILSQKNFQKQLQLKMSNDKNYFAKQLLQQNVWSQKNQNSHPTTPMQINGLKLPVNRIE